MADPPPPPSWGPADVLGPQAPVTPILDRPPGVVGDFGPGTLDLSLPSDGALMAAARPNPEQARDRIAVGKPANIIAMAGSFARAGASMDESYTHSQTSQQQLADAFTNNGAPVYDHGTHFGALPPDYPDAGTRLHDIAARLTTTADELTTTQTTAVTTVTTLLTDLGRQRTAWAGEVNAARNAAGLIPYAAIPGLTARRDEIAAGMQRDVNTAGTTITTAITTYEDHLQAVRTLLGDGGHVGFMNNPFTDNGQTGGQELRTPIQAGGPLSEIFPDNDGLPRFEGGFTPIPGGPEVLVNVPGPTGPTATDQGQLAGGTPFGGLGTNGDAATPPAGDQRTPPAEGPYSEDELNVVAGHLARPEIAEWAPNDAMIARIGDALSQGRPLTEGEQNFMRHELTEERLMGEGTSLSDAHDEAMKTHPLMKNYDPEVIDQYPEEFNDAWRRAWNLPPRW